MDDLDLLEDSEEEKEPLEYHKVYVSFNTEGILHHMITSHDPNMIIPNNMQEVTDKELKKGIKASHYKKVNGEIVPMSQGEIDSYHADLFVFKPSIDKAG